MRTKRDLRESYESILARGCLAEAERRAFLAGETVPGVFVTQTSGSSGEPPLRIPRSRSETEWHASRLLGLFAEHVGRAPERVVLMGGISHADAGQRVKLRGTEVSYVADDDRASLAEIDPDLLSAYPSVVRELVADRTIPFRSLRSLKLGGEPILPSDVEKIFARFPRS